jgi:hypothetical protein
MSRRAELKAIMRMLAKQIDDEMRDASSGPPVGFAILVFDFGEGGFCAHASNAQRPDLIKLFREHAARLEAGLASTAGDA